MSKEWESFGLGSIIFISFAMMRNIIPLHNMEFFVLLCIVFITATILAYLIINKRAARANSTIGKIYSVTAIVLLSIWIILFYINETNTEHSLNKSELIRHYFPFPLWAALMILGVLICLFLLRKEPNEKALNLRRKIRIASAFFFTLGTSIQFYAPNIFRDIQGGTYHSHAYTNSIINVCWLIPYSKNMESLYGHYGILYMPILKFMHKCFHVNYLTGIFILSAILAGISILLFLYILNYFAKNDLIFYLSMFAIGEYYFMLMQGGVYLQVHPHRMIFPILFTALALYEQKTEKRKTILAICFLTLSFVWSTEVGIVTTLSFALYRWIQNAVDGKSFSVQKLLFLLQKILIYTVIPFTLSYVIIISYNLLAGDSILSFREFMFPLILLM